MYTDFVVPNFPEKDQEEFISLGKHLGYQKIIFCYGDKSIKLKEVMNGEQNALPHILSACIVKSVQPRQKQITLLRANDNLRQCIEKRTVDIVYGLEEMEKRDKLHSRQSGLNNVLCKILSENDVIIGFSFNSLLRASGSRRAIIIGRMRQNIVLCRKYSVRMLLASFATTPFQMRSPRDLECFGALVGMHPSEAKKALSII